MPQPSFRGGFSPMNSVAIASAACWSSAMSVNLLESHSATVEMWLDCGAYGVLELSRITPRAVVAKAAREIPPCFADLIVTIDNSMHKVRVNLTGGFRKGRLAARAMPVDDAAPF